MKILVVVSTIVALSHPAFAGDKSSATASLPAPLPNKIFYVAGSSQKVCQLTGERDRQFHKSTFTQTRTRFGLVAVDLGYSFEHNGKLFFLFGDAEASPKFNGKPNGQNDPPRVRDDNDAIGFTTDTSVDRCLRLDFVRNANGAYKNPIVLNAQGQPAITLRTNEMPIAGISQRGRMYVVFGTDNQAANPTAPGAPKNLHSGPTRTVLAVSDDDANTFRYLYDFSKGPGAKFIKTTIALGAEGYLYFWGTPGGLLMRHTPPYFARKRADLINQPGEMEYFDGLGPDEKPRFSKNEADAFPLFVDNEGSSSEPHDCTGDPSVEWNRFVHRWVMLYLCTNYARNNLGGIYMRLAEQPWGPWSEPQTIFNAKRDGGLCHFIHRAATPQNPACDDLSPPARLGTQGGEYGPYIMSRFTTGDEAHGTSTFYYTMSTWNPYTQVIMKTTIQGSP